MLDRSGKRKSRNQNFRTQKLEHYLIVTDTKETEQNYIVGLRNSLPKDLREKLAIKICKTRTINLVEEALNMMSLHPQYSNVWIVFDRDQVKDFDHIVSFAAKKKINVGWSNPCIEIWFSAYFGSMPSYQNSVACCKGFSRQYELRTKQKYEKSEVNIYQKLCKYGNESQAVKIASGKFDEHAKNGKTVPSEMCPCTTIYVLVEEILKKLIL